MSKLILQPSGNSDAKKHYIETIENPVNLDSIRNLLNEADYNTLLKIYPDKLTFIWGVTKGKKNTNVKGWNKIDRGDVTLFSQDGAVFASGVTTYKIHNVDLAEHLWGYNDKGMTWEYIYFLSEIYPLKIKYPALNRLILTKEGAFYKDNYIIQGFTVLEEWQSLDFFKSYNLKSDLFLPEIDEDDFLEVENKLFESEETDAEYRAKRRLEQSYLKSRLFGKSINAKCSCCGKELPVSFLVAAHIKKRSNCIHVERIDPNVVMPMCKFGCDDLYEKGYITVLNGIFIKKDSIITTPSLLSYIESIEGNQCEYYNLQTEPYFEWHRKFHLFV